MRLLNDLPILSRALAAKSFVVVLPYVEEATAHVLADQVRKKIESLTIDADGHLLSVTISIGYGTKRAAGK